MLTNGVKPSTLLRVFVLAVWAAGCSGEPAAGDAGGDAAGDVGPDGVEDTPGDTAEDVGEDGEDGEDDAGPPGLSSALEEVGFTVQAGVLDEPDLESCCEPGGFCSGTNPTSPYGQLRLPPGPGQTAENPGTDAEGRSSAFRLREDEAVIVFGRTPPSCRYYGFTPYLMDRYDDGSGARVPLFASLGDTVNNLSMTTAGGAFDERTAIVVAANQHTLDRVREALLAAGHPAEAVNVVVLPASRCVFGLDQNADTFGMMLRVAVPEDPAALDRYYEAPPVEVLRATPAVPEEVTPLPEPVIRDRGTGTAEDLRAAVDDLEAALRAAVGAFSPSATITDVPTAAAFPAVFNGFSCIDRMSFCGGDNRDALYMGTGDSAFRIGPGYLIAFGVNHQATGKASYSNAVVQYVENAMGVVALDSTQMSGTADAYLPSHPDVDLLYAVAFARDCDAVPLTSCVEVPSDGCPLLPADAEANVVFRAYLEPATRTGPDLREIVVDRVLCVE
jgi:hypothetical protein